MKSLHAKLNETIEKMTSKQRDKFYESRKNGSPVEVQLNCAEQILAGKVKESSAPITKNNGAGDNGRSELFRESVTLTTEQLKESEFRERGETALFKSLGISDADRRRLKGLPPETLTSGQLREWRFLRSIHIGEADALRLAKKVA